MHNPGVDWEHVVGYASGDLVLPACRRRDLGLSGSLDRELGAFLNAVHVANTERNNELRDELSVVVHALNRVGIEPVLLKGAIRLLDGLYPDDGWRMLRDLDLLVPRASLTAAIQALASVGYASCGSGGELRRRGGACQIDMHTELFFTQRHIRLLQQRSFWARHGSWPSERAGYRFPQSSIRLSTSSATARSSILGMLLDALACAIGWRPRRSCNGGTKSSIGGLFRNALLRLDTGGRCYPFCSD